MPAVNRENFVPLVQTRALNLPKIQTNTNLVGADQPATPQRKSLSEPATRKASPVENPIREGACNQEVEVIEIPDEKDQSEPELVHTLRLEKGCQRPEGHTACSKDSRKTRVPTAFFGERPCVREELEEEKLLKVGTFNVKNIETNEAYESELLKIYDILAIQEHCLFTFQLAQLEDIFVTHHALSNSAGENNPLPPTQNPRAYGGMTILFRKSIQFYLENRYNYPTPPIRDIKGKETQTRNN